MSTCMRRKSKTTLPIEEDILDLLILVLILTENGFHFSAWTGALLIVYLFVYAIGLFAKIKKG